MPLLFRHLAIFCVAFCALFHGNARGQLNGTRGWAKGLDSPLWLSAYPKVGESREATGQPRRLTDSAFSGAPTLAELARAHPLPEGGGYHDPEHIARAAKLAYELAKALGLSEAEARFYRQVAFVHDMDPQRPLGSRPQPEPTITLMARDFALEPGAPSQLVPGHRGSFLRRERFEWDPLRLAISRVVVARSRHPFNHAPGEDPDQVQRSRTEYLHAVLALRWGLEDLHAQGILTARQVKGELKKAIAFAALFSEFCDKGSFYLDASQRSILSHMLGLVHEISVDVSHGQPDPRTSRETAFRQTLAAVAEGTGKFFLPSLGRTPNDDPHLKRRDSVSDYAYEFDEIVAEMLGISAKRNPRDPGAIFLDMPSRRRVFRWLPQWGQRHRRSLTVAHRLGGRLSELADQRRLALPTAARRPVPPQHTTADATPASLGDKLTAIDIDAVLGAYRQAADELARPTRRWWPGVKSPLLDFDVSLADSVEAQTGIPAGNLSAFRKVAQRKRLMLVFRASPRKGSRLRRLAQGIRAPSGEPGTENPKKTVEQSPTQELVLAAIYRPRADRRLASYASESPTRVLHGAARGGANRELQALADEINREISWSHTVDTRSPAGLLQSGSANSLVEPRRPFVVFTPGGEMVVVRRGSYPEFLRQHGLPVYRRDRAINKVPPAPSPAQSTAKTSGPGRLARTDGRRSPRGRCCDGRKLGRQ